MRFEIYEGNMARLEKKVATIRNKAVKYGCDFKFEKVGEVFKEVENRNAKPDENGEYPKETLKYIVIEAEGTAKVNNWEFAAEIEHTKAGNVVNGTGKYEIPSHYYYGACKCEHCKTDRARKDTYIVVNTETGEFKQVGKSCLRDFTNGLSTEAITQYYSFFERLAEFEAPMEGGGWRTRYYHTIEFLNYVAECVAHWGYVKNDNIPMKRSTRDRAYDYYCVKHGETYYYTAKEINALYNEMEAVGFDADKHEEESKALVEWCKNLPDDSNYNHNLRVAASFDYNDSGKLGLLASAAVSYNKWVEVENKKKQEAEAGKDSKYVGNVGDRITIEVEEIVAVTSWETVYGTTYILKMTDKDGNVFTWKTSNGSGADGNPHKITGTVKDHTEYRGVKQTELTRCKVEDIKEKPKKEEKPAKGTFNLDEVMKDYYGE